MKNAITPYNPSSSIEISPEIIRPYIVKIPVGGRHVIRSLFTHSIPHNSVA